MSKLHEYLEMIKKPLPQTPEEMDATQTRNYNRVEINDLEWREIDGIQVTTFSDLVEKLGVEGKYKDKAAAVKKWMNKHRKTVLYYSGEKPEGGNLVFTRNAVTAAQKAVKKYVITENLS